MDSELLQRIMDLAERTGDRVIVVNPESGAAHAIMPLDDYEELVDNRASLRHLYDDELEREISDLDIVEPPLVHKESVPSTAPMSGGDIEKEVEKELEAIKIAEQSQKNTDESGPLDILDGEADEEQYYLEPLE